MSYLAALAVWEALNPGTHVLSSQAGPREVTTTASQCVTVTYVTSFPP